MKKIVFYLLYPLIYLIASLPFGLLYMVSSFLYVILKLSGYRKKVVLMNLRNSFPEKTEAEIQEICNSYYKYLTDLILETLKTLKMTEKQALERCHFNNTPWLDELYKENKSIIIVMGHYGNWEYAVFQNHGYMGLYNGLGAREIQSKKGLKASQNILDHMGSTELAANLFRATQTEEKLKREKIKGKEKANPTHFEVGQKVRQTIKELGGTMPEDMPTEESIKKIESDQKKLNKKKKE